MVNFCPKQFFSCDSYLEWPLIFFIFVNFFVFKTKNESRFQEFVFLNFVYFLNNLPCLNIFPSAFVVGDGQKKRKGTSLLKKYSFR